MMAWIYATALPFLEITEFCWTTLSQMRVAAASGDGVEPPVGNEGAAHETSTRTLMYAKQQNLERLCGTSRERLLP